MQYDCFEQSRSGSISLSNSIFWDVLEEEALLVLSLGGGSGFILGLTDFGFLHESDCQGKANTRSR